MIWSMWNAPSDLDYYRPEYDDDYREQRRRHREYVRERLNELRNAPEPQDDLRLENEKRCRSCYTWFCPKDDRLDCDRCRREYRAEGLWCENCNAPKWIVGCEGCK